MAITPAKQNLLIVVALLFLVGLLFVYWYGGVSEQPGRALFRSLTEVDIEPLTAEEKQALVRATDALPGAAPVSAEVRATLIRATDAAKP